MKPTERRRPSGPAGKRPATQREYRPLLVRMGRLLRAARLRAGVRLVDVGSLLEWREGATYTVKTAAVIMSKIERGQYPVPSYRVLRQLLDLYGEDIDRIEVTFLWLEHLCEIPPSDAIAGGLVFASVLEGLDEERRTALIEEALRLGRQMLIQARRSKTGG